MKKRPMTREQKMISSCKRRIETVSAIIGTLLLIYLLTLPANSAAENLVLPASTKTFAIIGAGWTTFRGLRLLELLWWID